jgi:hypothetical protein
MKNYSKSKYAQSLVLTALFAGFGTAASMSHAAPVTTINGNDFDLAQFTGATVTYRSGGSVDFDGKLWDNANGVDGVTLGELAAGQFGSDPGDQVTLQDRQTPDWLQLDYLTPILISPTAHELVIFEISSQNFVDLEGTSFQVKFNGGGFVSALSAAASNFATAGAEDVNQLIFDLYDFGFNNGDLFSSLYIENLDSGAGTSDPDFIFAGIAGELNTVSVPEPGSMILLALGLLGIGARRLSRVTA